MKLKVFYEQPHAEACEGCVGESMECCDAVSDAAVQQGLPHCIDFCRAGIFIGYAPDWDGLATPSKVESAAEYVLDWA